MNDLPEGFVLDEPIRSGSQKVPGLPEGFVLDEALPQKPNQGSILAPLAHGALMGASDEIAGAGAALGALFTDETMGQAYARGRDAARDRYKNYEARNPRVSLGAELAGGLTSAVLPVGTAARGATLGAQIGRGAVTGGTAGAVYGFNSGEGGAMSRGVNAAGNAALGAGVGAAVPAAAAGVRRLVDAVRPNAATQAGISRGAQRSLAQDLANDKTSMQDVAQRVQQWGPEAMPADATPSFRTRAEAIVNYNHPGGAGMESKMIERARKANQMVQEGFDQFAGKRPDLARDERVLKAWQQRNAKRAYNAAETAAGDAPVSVDPRAKPYMDKARSRFRGEMRPFAEAPSDSYRFVSEAQKRMNQDARALETSAVGSERSRAGLIKANERLLVDALDAATDGKYSAAMKRYKGDSAIQEAMEYGRKVMLDNTDPSYVRARLAEANPEELAAIRRGARSALGTKAARVRGGTATRNEILTDGTDPSAKLEAIFGKDVRDKLVTRMEGLQEMATTNQTVRSALGSRTSRMQGHEYNPDRAKVPADVSVLGLAGKAGRAVAEPFIGRLMRPSGSSIESAGRFLSATGEERDKLLSALIASGVKPTSRNQKLVEALLQAAPRAVAGTGTPASLLGY